MNICPKTSRVCEQTACDCLFSRQCEHRTLISDGDPVNDRCEKCGEFVNRKPAQPAQVAEPRKQHEPVAWANERAIQWLHDRGRTASITTTISKIKSFERPLPLYTSLPASKSRSDVKPWVGLTKDEWFAFWDECEFVDGESVFPEFLELARAIEAKLREKNA